MPLIDQVKDQLIKNGYKELPNYKPPKSLLWEPDLVFSRGDYIYLVLVKTNSTIPPMFLNRLASLPKGRFVPLIIFAQKPKNEKNILSLGISLGRLVKGRLAHLNIRKQIPQSEVVKEIKKLKVIDIFVSSKQDGVNERKFIAERIEALRKIHFYPFNPPRLIEYDRFELKDLFKHIDKVMSNCQWIVILLEDNHSPNVSYEIKKAVELIRHENIFMFVKATKECHRIWAKEINFIEKMESKSIKYLPYSDLSELEVVLSRAIQDRMNEICKRENIEIFA